jgi:RHS Repeat
MKYRIWRSSVAWLALVAGAAAGCGEEPAPGGALAPGTSAVGQETVEEKPAAEAALLAAQTPVTMTYDAVGRLKTVEYPATGRRVVLTYDKAGNRTSRVIDTTITNPTPSLPPAPQ